MGFPDRQKMLCAIKNTHIKVFCIIYENIQYFLYGLGFHKKQKNIQNSVKVRESENTILEAELPDSIW